jgi:hypothetical protein
MMPVLQSQELPWEQFLAYQNDIGSKQQVLHAKFRSFFFKHGYTITGAFELLWQHPDAVSYTGASNILLHFTPMHFCRAAFSDAAT